MSISWRRVRAIAWKELREYRRNRSLVATMAILPLIFLIQPLVVVMRVPPQSAAQFRDLHLLLYMLAVPVFVPATLAAGAVVGERQQGSLEPILTTPITREEVLLGKALAALGPSTVIAYAVYAVFIIAATLFGQPVITAAILQWPDVAAQIVFTPALALLSIWVGFAISTRLSDLRVAQQLSLLGCLPIVAVTSLIGFDVIQPTVGLAVGLGALVLVLDVAGWRLVAPLFDRERLITGTR